MIIATVTESVVVSFSPENHKIESLKYRRTTSTFVLCCELTMYKRFQNESALLRTANRIPPSSRQAQPEIRFLRESKRKTQIKRATKLGFRFSHLFHSHYSHRRLLVPIYRNHRHPKTTHYRPLLCTEFARLRYRMLHRSLDSRAELPPKRFNQTDSKVSYWSRKN